MTRNYSRHLPKKHQSRFRLFSDDRSPFAASCRGVLAVAFSALFLNSFAQPAQIKDAMHRIYSTIEVAYNSNQPDTVTHYLAPDFTWRMMDGKTLDFAAAKKEITNELSNVQAGNWTITISNVIGSGALATAVVQYHFRGNMMGPSKQPYGLDLTSVERQTWIKQGEAWKMQEDSILSDHQHQGGVLVIPNVQTPNKPVELMPAFPWGFGFGYSHI